MLESLLKFRMDHCVLLADVRKAFLMIRLNRDKDKNRFCVFVKFNDKLACFRYKTLIFVFVSLPFILSIVIKYYVEKYLDGLCKDM